MDIRIPHPRVLVALLAFVAIAGGVYAATAQEDPVFQPVDAIPVGQEPELPQVTEEESTRARDALIDSAVFSSLSRGGDWDVVTEIPHTREGEKVGVALVVELGTPADSRGPWTDLHCQGTVAQEFEFGYSGITTLGAVFDSDGTLVSLKPLRFASSDSESEIVPKPTCPEGLEDKEN